MVEKKISKKKKETVAEIKNLFNKKTILVCSIKNLKSSQLQKIRKEISRIAVMKLAKISLIKQALKESKDSNLKEILNYFNSDYIFLFSDEDAFNLSSILADNKTPSRAKAGQEAPEDIWIKAGPTSLAPGPDISLLSSVGLQPRVEGGKISIAKDTLFIKKGEKITEEKASVLSKLDISPFQVGLEPIVAYMNGKIYLDVKVDKKLFLEELSKHYSKSLAFAVSLSYPTKETLPFILSKASLNENILKGLIKI